MKSTFTIIVFSLLSIQLFGQKIYRVDKEAYVSNKYSCKFYLFNDSTCYLKGQYFDYSKYFIYKGHIKKTNDTLYEFNFQPIVHFSCNKGYHVKDSVRFYFTQKDTLISSLKYKVKSENHNWTFVQLKGEKTTVFIKGIEDKSFLIDTKFIDPITKQKIVMTTGNISDPDLIYYGSKTQFHTLKITFAKNKLILYPDNIFVQDKDTFILEK